MAIAGYSQGIANYAAESRHPELWRGLVGAWLLNESGGVVAFDRLGRYPGTLTQMEPATDHILGHWRGFSFGALSFDGVNEYVAIPNGFFSAYPFTLVATFRLSDAFDDNAIFSLANNADNANWQGIRVIGNTVRATSRDGAIVRALGSSVSNNVWYTAVAVFASATSRTIYLDGVFGATDATNSATQANNVCAIGRFSDLTPGSYVAGDIAECLIYNRALNARQIKALFDIGPGGLFKLRRRVIGKAPVVGGQTPLDYERKTRGVARGVMRGVA